MRPGALPKIFDKFGGERDLFALRNDDASATLERDVHLLLDRVLDGDLDESEIADGPCLVGLICSHPAIVLNVRPSAKNAWGVVFQSLTLFCLQAFKKKLELSGVDFFRLRAIEQLDDCIELLLKDLNLGRLGGVFHLQSGAFLFGCFDAQSVAFRIPNY